MELNYSPIKGTDRFLDGSLGHSSDSTFNIIMNIGKLGDPHHIEYFFKMLGQTRDADLLIVLFGLGKNLNQDGDAAAVDIGTFLKVE